MSPYCHPEFTEGDNEILCYKNVVLRGFEHRL